MPFKFAGGGSSLCGCHGQCTDDNAGASGLVELEFLWEELDPRPETTGPWPKCGWKFGKRAVGVEELVPCIFVGVLLTEVEREVETTGRGVSGITCPSPKPWKS